MSLEAEIRHALVVATAEYLDPKLQRLRAPAADAERLAAVLGNPEVGGFEVELALNAEERDLRRRLARFFSDRRPDDLLFLHFSCHAVKDPHGDLYFAAADTELDLLSATGIPAGWVNEQLDRTRSRRTVLLLDCCFSGSFPFGARARAGEDVSVPDQFEGHGRGLAVITASSAMEYAYEGDSLSGDGQPSYFTEAVVDALESGKADRDQDHLISIQELYDYVYDRLKEKTPSQTPTMKSELEGPLHVARTTYRPPVTPVKLNDHLVALTEHRYVGAREGAVDELEALLGSQHSGTVLAARQALERMVDDDSRRVSERANAALRGTPAAETSSSQPPPDTPVKRRREFRADRPPTAEADEREAPPAQQPTPDQDAVYVRAVGSEPQRRSVPSPVASKRRPRWRLLGGGAFALVIAGLIAVILLAGGGQDTRLQAGGGQDTRAEALSDEAIAELIARQDAAMESEDLGALKRIYTPKFRIRNAAGSWRGLSKYLTGWRRSFHEADRRIRASPPRIVMTRGGDAVRAVRRVTYRVKASGQPTPYQVRATEDYRVVEMDGRPRVAAEQDYLDLVDFMPLIDSDVPAEIEVVGRHAGVVVARARRVFQSARGQPRWFISINSRGREVLKPGDRVRLTYRARNIETGARVSISPNTVPY